MRFWKMWNKKKAKLNRNIFWFVFEIKSFMSNRLERIVNDNENQHESVCFLCLWLSRCLRDNLSSLNFHSRWQLIDFSLFKMCRKDLSLWLNVIFTFFFYWELSLPLSSHFWEALDRIIIFQIRFSTIN